MAAGKPFIFFENIGQKYILKLQENWVTENIPDIIESIETIPFTSVKENQLLVIDACQLGFIDMGGSLVILDLLEKIKNLKIPFNLEISSFAKDHLSLAETFKAPLPKKKNTPLFFMEKVAAIGEKLFDLKNASINMIGFLGEVVLKFLLVLFRPKFFRFFSLVKEITTVGVQALPIVTLISLLIGVVLAYQGITQLERFGAQIYTVNLLGLGILREVGVLLTSVVIAGRSGSAFTAEIGLMVVNEEVSALKVMGVSPFYLLVLPRILALTISLPLLTFWSDIIALLGGAIMMNWLMDLSIIQYKNQLMSAVTPTAFWVGIIKAPFFGFIIAFVGCFEGLQVKGTSRSVGIHTTKSVVESVFLIIVLDAFFSVFFAYLGI